MGARRAVVTAAVLSSLLAVVSAPLGGLGALDAPALAAPVPAMAPAAGTAVAPAPIPPSVTPTAVGVGGAVATVDPTATAAALDVLRRGGNAVDAAIAAAATLGVTEPFSAGVGGGGFFVYYDADTGTVQTIDGREAAPASMTAGAFVDPVTAAPLAFPEARVSGISVGVPGTVRTWEDAVRQWGTRPLSELLAPAIRAAEQGFVVDPTFRSQIEENAAPFARFRSTADLYLPGGAPPAVGSVFRNPDLAATYRLLARFGPSAFYHGPVAEDLVATVRRPPVAPAPPSAQPFGSWTYPVRPGTMTLEDLDNYRVRRPAPTHSRYRGLDVYGMATPSSGGTAVSEALNILERSDLASLSSTQVLHRYLEAGALAFADRNRYVGDWTPRPLVRLLAGDDWAARRSCRIDPAAAAPKPVAPGTWADPVCGPAGAAAPAAAPAPAPAPASDHEQHTTNLTVADRWGDVVEYTFTIEQIGGNAMVVPGRGFLLNNELTDFNFEPTQGDAYDPNLPGPGKRPRSSMSPTIVVEDGRPRLALGSPGGSTIITTVLQMLVNRIDRGMSLPEALAAPRAAPRNTTPVQAEPAFLAAPEAAALTALGHRFAATDEIGSATAIELGPGPRMTAAAEPVRRGGGSAAVVAPAR